MKIFDLAVEQGAMVGVVVERLNRSEVVDGVVCRFATTCEGKVVYHWGYNSIFNLIEAR